MELEAYLSLIYSPEQTLQMPYFRNQLKLNKCLQLTKNPEINVKELITILLRFNI